MWRKGTLVCCWWECRLVQPLWKTVWNFLKKLKMELPYDLVIPLLGIYLKKPKTLIQKDICTPMFIVALLAITQMLEAAQVPIDRQMNKKDKYIHTLSHKKE